MLYLENAWLERMAGACAATRLSGRHPVVRTLRLGDVAALRLPGRRGAESVRRLLDRIPVDRFGYRRRSNMRSLARGETGRDRQHRRPGCRPPPGELLRAAVERCAEQGDELVLTVELDSRRSPARYERAGLEMLEEVITYEIGIARAVVGQRPLRLVRVDANDEAAIDLVTTSIRLRSPGCGAIIGPSSTFTCTHR